MTLIEISVKEAKSLEFTPPLLLLHKSQFLIKSNKLYSKREGNKFNQYQLLIERLKEVEKYFSYLRKKEED